MIPPKEQVYKLEMNVKSIYVNLCLFFSISSNSSCNIRVIKAAPSPENILDIFTSAGINNEGWQTM